jgi:hypothetical protein
VSRPTASQRDSCTQADEEQHLGSCSCPPFRCWAA